MADPDAPSADELKARIIRARISPVADPNAGGVLGALGKGALHGLENPLYGGAQIGARMQEPTAFSEPDPSLVSRVDAETKAREQEYQADPTVKAHPTAAGIGKFGGETAANLPLMMVPGGIGTAALTGAAAAVTEPTTGDDFWSDKKRQAALGLLGGAAGGAVGNVVGRAISPTMGKASQTLADAGVSLTPGQALGGIPRRAEEAAKSFPILGSFIRGAEGRSLDSFDSAVINQALEPIGGKLPKDLEAGSRGKLSYAADSIGAAYEKVLPKMTFREDPEFIGDLDSLRELAKEMPPGQVEQFSNILQNRVAKRLGPQGNMDGLTLNQVWSELGNFASTYRSSSDAAQRQLGTAIDATRAIIHDALTRQNPSELVTELENARASYDALVRHDAVKSSSANHLDDHFTAFPNTALRSIPSPLSCDAVATVATVPGGNL